MKNLLLILALFVVGCASENVTKLSCEPQSSNEVLKQTSYLTINETKETIRFNLLPEVTYKNNKDNPFGQSWIAYDYDIFEEKQYDEEVRRITDLFFDPANFYLRILIKDPEEVFDIPEYFWCGIIN